MLTSALNKSYKRINLNLIRQAVGGCRFVLKNKSIKLIYIYIYIYIYISLSKDIYSFIYSSKSN